MILLILDAIAAPTKKTEKLAILEMHKDNEVLKRVFELAYSPTIKFNLKKIPAYTSVEEKYSLESGLFDLHDELCVRKTRGHKASDYLAAVLGCLAFDDQEVVKRIIAGDLRIGASGSTANKVWPKLINQQPNQLATSQSAKAIDYIFDQGDAFADLKADGARCGAIMEEGEPIEFVSRNSLNYTGLTKIDFYLKMLKAEGFVIDGELIQMTADGVQNRETGNGIVNKASNGTISDAEQKTLVFQVWDIIPIDVYYSRHNTQNMPYQKRKKLLTNMLAKLFYGEVGVNCIQMVPTTVVKNKEEADKIYMKYIELGYEGIILKSMNSLWVDKRSKEQVKYKQELYADLEIIDFEEGTGKLKNSLGAFVVRSADGLVECNVGIGDKDTKLMTDKFRKYVWENKEEFRHTIGEFKYNYVTKARGATISKLFLPRYTRPRPDKSIANTIDAMM